MVHIFRLVSEKYVPSASLILPECLRRRRRPSASVDIGSGARHVAWGSRLVEGGGVGVKCHSKRWSTGKMVERTSESISIASLAWMTWKNVNWWTANPKRLSGLASQANVRGVKLKISETAVYQQYGKFQSWQIHLLRRCTMAQIVLRMPEKNEVHRIDIFNIQLDIQYSM